MLQFYRLSHPDLDEEALGDSSIGNVFRMFHFLSQKLLIKI